MLSRTARVLGSAIALLILGIPEVGADTGSATVTEDGRVVGRGRADQSLPVETPANTTAAPRPTAASPVAVWSAEERWVFARGFLPECNGVDVVAAEWCVWPESVAGEVTRPARAGVEALVREVVAVLELPEGVPLVGPDPSWNEWGMVVVGHPLWLWTAGPGRLTTSSEGFGLSVGLDARAVGTVFSMGDGGSVSCEQMVEYVRGVVVPGTPSPVCGYVYERAASGAASGVGVYTVTATTSWRVGWEAAGYAGTLTTTRTASRQVPVGELQAVVLHP